ncbi:MAG: calcium/sodium antiporter [Cyclobacteriaceae bacterium]|jgi:cation:H+ antiporter|nr:calcium/sodium antiporter [Cyclobacteriaceae bacterium]
MFLSFTLLLVGFVILIKGADFLVGGSSSVAKKFNVSNLAIGLTVVAFGTSTPELLVNIMSSAKGYNDAAFGNVIGSNIFNLLFILGIAGIIYPLVVHRNTVSFEVPLSLIAAVVLFVLVNDTLLFGSAENTLSRLDAVILLACFGGFMYYVSRTMKDGLGSEEGGPIKIYKTGTAVLLIIIGLAMLVGGGSLVVDNAVAIAKYYGLSEKLIGLTILAAGTSLPELATSAVAAYRKNTDIAIGNVVGSNIFNIFFILGITGVINPTPYNVVMNFDLYVLGASTIMLMIFMFTINQRKLDRWEAVLMFASYVVYTVFLVVMEN